ncbi:uncharacterized protein LOC110459952 isoform X7 [Mizuhopecten yessoensis]|uniref:uncharacterized protein LOC110459952 isoform X7 n=1 Tax=Mizuhopecten yessoensis TaxID=6573 RepID=UPI000B45C348|nr:uncharacterized protein LOC110459952 isoform X7 [Mizuhopecten yessoensis]
MSSMNYQKVYMNQIHSSSLLCQLSHMWKGQMLCDAIIKTGQVITKAHRVVLVAACPMLQSMENASAGSHLEVRLAADIKQESVNTFLQYLYEGFMMLTEENVRDVEKVGRLLQVDSVIKCCADFYKCMNAKTGAPFPGSSYKYSFSGHDLAEFRHVRATGLQKTASERIIKRVSDFPRPGSPGSKRPRLYRGGSPSDVTVIGSDKADDTASMSHSYMSGAPDPWDRVPKLGSGMSRQGATGRNSQPGVIEIIEERIELVQTEPPEKDSGQPSSSRSSQKSAAVSIAVTSQFNTEPDISVVNVFGSPETQSTTAASNAITSSSSSRGSITVSPLTIFQEPHPQSSSAPEPSSSSSTVESSGQVSEIQFAGFSQRQDVVDSVYGMGKQQKSVDSQLTSTPHQRPFPVSVSPITQPKPFAAGSAVQAGISSPSSMSLPLGSPSSSKSVQKPRSAPASPAERARDSRRASEAAGMHSTADMTPDLSIVKIESSNHETGGLDMHVDMPEEGVMRIHPGRMPDEQEEASDKEIEDWAREEMSNEGSNISGDQNNSWYMGTFKEPIPKHRSVTQQNGEKQNLKLPPMAAVVASSSSAPTTVTSSGHQQLFPGFEGADPALLALGVTESCMASGEVYIDIGGDNQDDVVITGNTPGLPQQHKQQPWGTAMRTGKPKGRSPRPLHQGQGPPQGHATTWDQMAPSRDNQVVPVELHRAHPFQDAFPDEPGAGERSPRSVGAMLNHRAIHTPMMKNKPCAYCLMRQVRTKSGWYVYTTYKCEVCDVPLCTGQRNCFTLYHMDNKLPGQVVNTRGDGNSILPTSQS